MKTHSLKSGLLPLVVTLLIIVYNYRNISAQQAWEQVPSPDQSETRNMLRGISGTSSMDVWTVGEFESNAGDLNNLIMHWNGSDWQIYPGTDLGDSYNDLWDVSAIASNDVWAAGTYNVPGNSRSQLLHWNGSGWTHTSLPDIQGGSFLFSIDAISANDIWAVGGQAGSPTDPPYAIHYNGSSWTEFPAANPGTYGNRFYAVDGIASNDVWAVGRQSNSYGDFHAMAQHWNGSNWTNSTLPTNVLTPIGDLESVTMIASDDVWALGSTITGDLLMIHWDGTSWSEMDTEGAQGGVVAWRTPDLFSLGYRISEWDGTGWVVTDSLNQLSFPTLVSSVTFSNGDIWAAGITYDTAFHTLVYRTVSGPLPVIIDDYSVKKTGNYATMRWSTFSELNIKEFVMEKSPDAKEFISVKSIPAYGSAYNYTLIDQSPFPGLNYYRLKSIDTDGKEEIFPVVTLNFNDPETDVFIVCPNPISGRMINLQFNNEEDGILYLHDQFGKEIMNKKITGDQSSIYLSLPSNISSGIFILTLMNEHITRSEKIFVP
jgi:hypothetical protein